LRKLAVPTPEGRSETGTAFFLFPERRYPIEKDRPKSEKQNCAEGQDCPQVWDGEERRKNAQERLLNLEGKIAKLDVSISELQRIINHLRKTIEELKHE